MNYLIREEGIHHHTTTQHTHTHTHVFYIIFYVILVINNGILSIKADSNSFLPYSTVEINCELYLCQ